MTQVTSVFNRQSMHYLQLARVLLGVIQVCQAAAGFLGVCQAAVGFPWARQAAAGLRWVCQVGVGFLRVRHAAVDLLWARYTAGCQPWWWRELVRLPCAALQECQVAAGLPAERQVVAGLPVERQVAGWQQPAQRGLVQGHGVLREPQVAAGLPVECQVAEGWPVECQGAGSRAAPHGWGQVLEHTPWAVGRMHRAVGDGRLGCREGANLKHHTLCSLCCGSP